MTESHDTKIAIVGRAGRFPGARNVTEYWQMLAEGRTGATKLTAAELLAAGESRKAIADPNYVPVSHILPDMQCFDAGFWGFSPREAQILDPQHRHFLEAAWEAFEDAGHMPENFEGRIGVFAGSGMQAYLPYNLLSNPDLVEEIGLFLLRHTGNDKDFLPTRLSYLLNLTGPSVAVQTACSTGLVAVHMAVNSLLNMECEMAIAGGVTIELPHHVGYKFAEGEILSPDGLCRAFDNDSQGTVFGSGTGLVVLRRYEDALEDGDDIKAVILASAINNDGAGKASYLAPSVDGQAEAAAEAVALAGVEPGSISYIEAHGTGTPIGDPIELSALTQVYGEAGPGKIGIGSVKTNIGHLDTAAGSASLIKVIEAMRHKRLPASLNFETPNARFDWEDAPFRVVSEARDWMPDGPRRAAVNSLGVGGTNAHVVVEEAPEREPAPGEDGQWRLFPFSAASAASLDATPAQWAGFLAADDTPALSDVAFTLREGRRQFPERMAVAARDKAGLAAAMAARVSGAKRRGKATETAPKIVFLFPGGGAQYPGAGAELMAAEPVFARAVEDCFAALPENAPADLRAMMFERDLDDEEARTKLGRSGYAIPALFILEYAYARLWDAWGVTPDAIFAHSVGEYAGAVLAGAMSMADALKVVTLRGQVMDDAPEGAMTTVPMCAERARGYLGQDLDIAAINSATTTVVSGQVADIEALEARLADEGFEARRIHIDVAAHSRQLEGQLDRFREGFDGVAFSAPTLPMVSSLRGDWGQGDDFASAEYWVRHLRNTVRFTDAIATALAEPDCVVIEVGPGQTLGPLVEAAELEHAPRAILPSAPRPRDEDHEMAVALASAGGLWAQGWPVDFAKLPGGVDGRRVSMPTYAFEKQRHWIEPGRGVQAEAEEDLPLELARKAEMSDWFEALRWREADPCPTAELADTDWLILAGGDALSAAVLDGLAEGRARVTQVRAGDGFAQTDDGFVLRPGLAEDFEALLDALPDLPANILMMPGFAGDIGFDAAYNLARSMQMADAGAGLRLVLAASGAVSLDPDAPATAPGAAALLGLVRVAPRELSGISAGFVDVPEDPALAPALLAEVLSGHPEDDDVALRDGARFLRTRTASPAVAPGTDLPARLTRGGVYVLTGGAGGIGRQMARWLASTAQAKLALLSRSPAADPALAAEIEAAGGALMTVAADVTDRTSLSAALDRVRAELGEITGVIHGAGLIDDRPLSSKSIEEAHAVIDPKLTGALHLDALLPVGSVDLFAVISSSSVVLGGAGQADYAGANASLEALAAARPDGMSIAWGVWRDTGMAAREYGAGEAEITPPPGERRDEDGAILFDSYLDPDTDWRLLEHVVGGQPVLPGTAYLDLAYAAARAVLGADAAALSDLGFELPMVFGDGLPRRVTTRLVPAASGSYALSIESRVGPEEPVVHMRANLSPARKRATPKPLTAALIGQELDPSAHSASEGLIEFGPRWRTVDRLTGAASLTEGRFALPTEFAGETARHPVHPGLMDLAWTVGLFALPEAERSGKVYVPMSIERISFDGPLPATLTARAQVAAKTPGEMVTFDVALFDEAGARVALIEGFALRAVAGGDLAASAEAAPLTVQLLSTGIRKSEAADLFARVFDHPEQAIVVSPVSLDLVRLAMEERPKQAEAQGGQGSGGDIADPVAAKLAGIWSDILGVSGIGPEDDFFALGGHSLNAVRMVGRIKKEFGVSLSIATLFQAPTLGGLSDYVAEAGGLDRTAPAEGGESTPQRKGSPRAWSPLVPISKGNPDILPFYMVHGAGGNVLNFRALMQYMDPAVPFIGLQALGSDGGSEVDTTIEAMATRYLAAMREHQPTGPYRIGGYSGGGVIACEMAQQLKDMGETVERIYLLDTLEAEASRRRLSLHQRLWAARHWSMDFALGWLDRRKARGQHIDAAQRIRGHLERGEAIPEELIGFRMTQVYLGAQGAYQTRPYDGAVTLFKAKRAGTLFLAAGELLGWQDYLTGEVEVQAFDCDHFDMMSEPAIAEIGELLSASLMAGR